MINATVGIKLKELRKQTNYTQQNIADIFHLKNRTTVASWENGLAEPDVITFLKLCKLYNVRDIMLEFLGKATFREEDAVTLEIENNYRDLNPSGRQLLISYSALLVKDPANIAADIPPALLLEEAGA
jgi:transcriptional regulator with XRE-family HTH domain